MRRPDRQPPDRPTRACRGWVFLTVLLLLATAPAGAADFETAAEAVKNMGLGWNLGNTLDANSQGVTDVTRPDYWGQQDVTSETCWGQYVTKPDLMKMMKDAGFGAIRLPVTWYNHLDPEGNVDPAWMARVRDVVDDVTRQGMYCIINVHHDTGADGTSFHSWLKADTDSYARHKARYEKLWRQIADEFQDYGQLLLFEGYNEMLDRYSSWCYASFAAPGRYDDAVAADAYDAINSYARSFVNTVRATGGNNARRNLIVSTYAAANGYGTWSTHLTEPLTALHKPDGEDTHIAFEVHAYPSLANSDGTDRPFAAVKAEVDDIVALLKTHLAAKGAPVIIGEWGTANVDAAQPDHLARPELMKQFCHYFVRQCKASNIATFFWMALSDGADRLFPAFSQPQLAQWLLQAYHGSSYQPTLPQRSDYGTSCVAATVDFQQQWAELNLAVATFTADDYTHILLELEETPPAGLLDVKVYGASNTNHPLTAATTAIPFTPRMGTVTRVTLQCMQGSGTARLTNAWLVKPDGEKVPSDPSVFWGCTLRDVDITYPDNISAWHLYDSPRGEEDGEHSRLIGSSHNRGSGESGTYTLDGRKTRQAHGKGLYIKNRKKVYYGGFYKLALDCF